MNKIREKEGTYNVQGKEQHVGFSWPFSVQTRCLVVVIVSSSIFMQFVGVELDSLYFMTTTILAAQDSKADRRQAGCG
jgi:hypothetical protein